MEEDTFFERKVADIVKVARSITLTVWPTGAKLLLPKLVMYECVPPELITMSKGPENPPKVSTNVLSLTRIFDTVAVPKIPS